MTMADAAGARMMGLMSRVLAIFLTLSAPAGAVTVRLHDAEIDASFITLGDVAEIGGVDRASAESIASVVIGYAPPPGRSRTVTPEMARMGLLQRGILPAAITMQGGAAITVTRAGQQITAEEISAAVLEALTPLAEEGVTLTVERVPAVPSLPRGAVEMEIERPARMERTFFVPVTLRVGTESIKVSVTMHASRLGTILLAARRLERGMLLTASDFVEKSVDVYEAPRDAVRSSADAIGAVVQRTINANTPLTSAAIEKEAVIRRGDRVQISASIPGLTIQAAGEALDGGRIGQVIRVRNTDSRKIVSGRVTGAGEVMIVE